MRAGEYVLDGSLGWEPVPSLPAEFPRRVWKFRPTATRPEIASNHAEQLWLPKGYLCAGKSSFVDSSLSVQNAERF